MDQTSIQPLLASFKEEALNDEKISPFQELEAMGGFAFDLELAHEKPIQIVPTTKRQFNKLDNPLY